MRGNCCGSPLESVRDRWASAGSRWPCGAGGQSGSRKHAVIGAAIEYDVTFMNEVLALAVDPVLLLRQHQRDVAGYGGRAPNNPEAAARRIPQLQVALLLEQTARFLHTFGRILNALYTGLAF